MHERLLDFLRCPACGARLELEVFVAERTSSHEEIVSGLVRCGAGDHGYPVVRGIPRLLPDAFETFRRDVQNFPLAEATPAAAAYIRGVGVDSSQAYDRRTRESFSNEWEHHEVGDRTWGLGLDERVDTYFLRSVDIPRGELDGKLMLDAGCGNGSQSVAYTRFGLEVIAIDLSSGLEHGYAFRHRYAEARPDRVHFVQADLQTPGLEPSSVDIIHSAGVLHHTPDTERTFRGLCPLVGPGGTFYVWLYKHERFATRSVNALRALSTRTPPPTVRPPRMAAGGSVPRLLLDRERPRHPRVPAAKPARGSARPDGHLRSAVRSCAHVQRSGRMDVGGGLRRDLALQRDPPRVRCLRPTCGPGSLIAPRGRNSRAL